MNTHCVRCWLWARKRLVRPGPVCVQPSWGAFVCADLPREVVGRALGGSKPAKTLLLRSRRGGTTGNAHPVIVPGRWRPASVLQWSRMRQRNGVVFWEVLHGESQSLQISSCNVAEIEHTARMELDLNHIDQLLPFLWLNFLF